LHLPTFQQPSLKRLCWIKEHFLGHQRLLVLKHLFARVPDDSKLVHVELHLFLEEFKSAEHAECVADPDIVFAQPNAEDLLLAAGLPA